MPCVEKTGADLFPSGIRYTEHLYSSWIPRKDGSVFLDFRCI